VPEDLVGGEIVHQPGAAQVIVDRGGVIRYAYTGSYVVPEAGKMPIRPIPANDEILRELERCA